MTAILLALDRDAKTVYCWAMKSKSALAALLFACCVAVTAAHAEMNWPRIAAAIDLNRQQVRDLREAESRMLGGIQRIESALQANDIDREQAGELFKRVRAAFQEAWLTVLTEEQNERWHQLHRRAARTDQLQRDVSLSRRIGAVVDLTRDQVNQLGDAETAFHQRVRHIAGAARDGGLTRRETQTHLQTARIELNQALLDILSERQVGRIRESRIYDGNLGGDDVAPLLLDLVGDPVDATAVSASSWGQIKGELVGE